MSQSAYGRVGVVNASLDLLSFLKNSKSRSGSFRMTCGLTSVNTSDRLNEGGFMRFGCRADGPLCSLTAGSTDVDANGSRESTLVTDCDSKLWLSSTSALVAVVSSVSSSAALRSMTPASSSSIGWPAVPAFRRADFRATWPLASSSTRLLRSVVVAVCSVLCFMLGDASLRLLPCRHRSTLGLGLRNLDRVALDASREQEARWKTRKPGCCMLGRAAVALVEHSYACCVVFALPCLSLSTLIRQINCACLEKHVLCGSAEAKLLAGSLSRKK